MKSKKHTKNNKELSGPMKFARPIAFASLCGIAVTVVVMLLLALVMTMVDLPQALVEPLVIVAAGIGAFGSGYICSRKSKEKGFFLGLICGGILFLLSMVAGIVVVPGGFGTIALVKLFAILLCAALGGSVGVNRRPKRR